MSGPNCGRFGRSINGQLRIERFPCFCAGGAYAGTYVDADYQEPGYETGSGVTSFNRLKQKENETVKSVSGFLKGTRVLVVLVIAGFMLLAFSQPVSAETAEEGLVKISLSFVRGQASDRLVNSWPC